MRKPLLVCSIVILIVLFSGCVKQNKEITTTTIQTTTTMVTSTTTSLNECEIHGGKCYGLGDIIADSCENHDMKTLPYKCQLITPNTQCCK